MILGSSPDDTKPWCYDGSVNTALIRLIPPTCRRILDVGCGTGANAKALADSGATVWGITYAESEARTAAAWCEDVFLTDLDGDLPNDLPTQLDLIFLSHVLEHLKRPREVVLKLSKLLRPGGYVAVAVPNMAHLPLRKRLLKGDWSRNDEGAFDRTHLQFWSFQTATDIVEQTGLTLLHHGCEIMKTPFPLRGFLPTSVSRKIDQIQEKTFPNLFGWQTLLLAQKA